MVQRPRGSAETSKGEAKGLKGVRAETRGQIFRKRGEKETKRHRNGREDG